MGSVVGCAGGLLPPSAWAGGGKWESRRRGEKGIAARDDVEGRWVLYRRSVASAPLVERARAMRAMTTARERLDRRRGAEGEGAAGMEPLLLAAPSADAMLLRRRQEVRVRSVRMSLLHGCVVRQQRRPLAGQAVREGCVAKY